jgi:uncharacterized protein involved in exopolysaccharide biosynthesis
MAPQPTSAVRYYLAIFRRRWIVMAFAVLIPLLAGIALYVSTAKTYRGSAEVVINRQSLADEVNGTPDPTAGASDFIDIVQTDADAARSIQVAQKALAAIPSTRLTPQQFLNSSDVTASPNADLLTFTADSRNSETATRLASAYAQAYTSYSVAQSAAAFRTASDQLNSRIAAARAAHSSELVKSLKAKAAALESLAALQTANEFVVTPSSIAKVTSPQKSVDIGLFLLLGLVLAVALTALLEGLTADRR